MRGISMKKLILVGFSVAFVSACSDQKSENKKDEQFKGTFVATEVQQGRIIHPTEQQKRMYVGREHYNTYPVEIPKKTKQIVVMITDQIYHEYVITQTETSRGYKSTPRLEETVYKYTKREDGSVEMEKIADACGKYYADEDERVVFTPITSKGMLQSTGGQLLSRQNPQEVKALVAQIEQGKEDDEFDISCWKWTRSISNGWNRFWSEDNK